MRLLLRWRQGEVSLHDIRAEGSGDIDDRGPSVEISLGKVKLDFELSPLTLTSETERARLVEALLTLSRSSSVPDLSVCLEIPAGWGIGLRLPPLKLPPAELAEHLEWELSNALLDPVDQYRYHYELGNDGSIRLAALRVRLLDLIQKTAAEAGFKLLDLHLEEADLAQINFLESSSQPKAALPMVAPPPPKLDQPQADKPRQERRKGASSQPSWFFGLILIAGIIVVALWGWMKLTGERRPGQTSEPAIGTAEIRTEAETPASQTPSDTTASRGTLARDTTAAALEPPREQSADRIQVSATGYAPMANCLGVLKQIIGETPQPAPFELISFTGDRFLLQLTGAQGADPDEFCSRLRALSGVLDVKADQKGRGASISGKLSMDAGSQSASPLEAAQIIAAGKKCGLRHASAQELIFAGAGSQVISFLNDLAARHAAIYRLILVPWGEAQYRVALEL